jgi:drug/metabolite transporter (DMT)-like permease
VSAVSYAGVPLALLAAAAYNLGLIAEKRALDRMPALDVRRAPRMVAGLLGSRAWLAGFALMLAGLACQAVVLTFEPVTVVQPVLACGVVLVPVLSRLLLRERLGGGEACWVAALAAAVLLLAASAAGAGAQAGHRASPGPMAAVIVPSVLAGAALAAGSLRGRGAGQAGAAAGPRHGGGGAVTGAGTGLLYGVAALAVKALSGILAGHRAAAGAAAAVAASPYLYLLGGCLAAGMLLFQAGLQASRASVIVPVSAVTGSAYVIVTATWLFHEHLPAGPARLGLRAAGIALAALAVIALSRQAADRASGTASGDAGMAAGPLADVRRR